MFARARVSKTKLAFSRDISCQNMSKRIKNSIFWQTRFLQVAPGCLGMAPRTLQILTNRVNKCQTVSKSVQKWWTCKKTRCLCRVSKRIKTYQKTYFLELFDTIFWHLRSGSVGVQVRVKTCQKDPRVKTCLHAPACQKTKPSFLRDVAGQNVSFFFVDTPDSFKWLPDGSKWLPGPYKSWPTGSKSVKQCQKVSKNNGNVRKHNAFAECQNVSKRVKKQSRVKTCQNVSKKCQKVSKKCQKRVKTYQNVSKNYRGAVFRVKTYQKYVFLTLFDTFLTLDFVF